MSETYLDTLADVVGAGIDGLPYGKLTRAQRVHVRSLKSDEILAAFVGDDSVTLDTEGAVICLTVKGEAYVDALRVGGLLPEAVVEVAEEAPVSKPKRKRQTARKPKAAPESVTKPRDVWVPGGSQDTRKVKVSTIDERIATVLEDRFADLLAQLTNA